MRVYLLALVWTTALLLDGPTFVNCQWRTNTSSIEQQIIDTLFRNYDKSERPSNNAAEPTNVILYFKITDIRSVSFKSREMTVDMYFRQKWQDPRLAWREMPQFKYYTKYMDWPHMVGNVWKPDPFFRNGRKGYRHSMMRPNLLFRVSPDGSVLYSQRITMTFSCRMSIWNFPMDTQTCNIDIGSYGYRSSQVRLRWRQGRNAVVIGTRAAGIPDFKLPSEVQTIDCTMQYATSTGSYSCLLAKISLQRRSSVYVITYYVPSAFLVIVSWTAFWLEPNAFTARVALGLFAIACLTVQLALSSMATDFLGITALHIWLMACICFVFCSLWEGTLTNILFRRLQSRRGGDTSSQATHGISRFLKISGDDQVIDIISRFLFPVAFLIFNLVYWLLVVPAG